MITCKFEDGGAGKLRHITVNVLVLNKERTHILLARRSAKFSEPNLLTPPGGFMGRDETATDAALREGLEETGYELQNPTLFRINDNPNRPKEDRQNVDMIFFAEAGDHTSTHDSEITNVQWYELANLPSPAEFAFDHFENVSLLLKFLNTPFQLPVIGKVEV